MIGRLIHKLINGSLEQTCCEISKTDCRQGRTCPVRLGTHKPAEAVHQIEEPAPAGWQPIETAPKDGSVFDVWVADSDSGGYRVADAYWSVGDHFFRYSYEEMSLYGVDITHWMPIPEGPTTSALPK